MNHLTFSLGEVPLAPITMDGKFNWKRVTWNRSESPEPMNEEVKDGKNKHVGRAASLSQL
jgi:hypothetical protein